MDHNNPLADLPPVLTVDEAARILRLGRSSVYEAVRQRLIPAIRVGRSIRIPKAVIEKMLEGGENERQAA